MRVFVDTNIYLHYFDHQEDWGLFDQLRNLVLENKFKLIFPQITYDEIVRNVYGAKNIFLKKDVKRIHETITISSTNPKSFTDLGLNQEKIEEIKQSLEAIKIKKLTKFVKSRLKYTGKYLNIIKSVKSVSLTPKQTQEMIQQAVNRHWLGNPPSKRVDPVGDNLVWEMLLENYTDEELTIISDDGDWRRDEASGKIHPILKSEWNIKSNKFIELKTSLSEFISNIIPGKVTKEIVDKEKEESIKTSIFESYVPSQVPPSIDQYLIGSATASGVQGGSLSGYSYPIGVEYIKCKQCGNMFQKISTLTFPYAVQQCPFCRSYQ